MPVHLFRYFLQQDALPAGSRMFPPPEDLRAVIEGCWLFGPQDAEAGSLAFSDGIPALVFHIDEAQRVRQAWCSSQLLKNIHLSPVVYTLLVVRFTATGFYRIAPHMVPLLRHQPVWALSEVLGKHGEKDLQAAENILALIASLETLLRRAATPGTDVPPLLESALQTIREAKGQLSIESLAARLHVNYKWLERKFISITGISPKEHARLQRFLHAYFHLRRTRGRDLMGTAVLNGYYDQNHFTKEFRQFAGKPPLAYILQS